MNIERNSGASLSSTRRWRQRGSAILETGLLLPLLMYMACGTMDFARLFYAGIAVESAARAGVQYGSYSVTRSGATGGMNTAAENDFSGQGLTGITISSRSFCGCNADTTEVSCSTATCSGRIPNGYVETTASYTFDPIVPYPGIPRNVAITSRARIRVE